MSFAELGESALTFASMTRKRWECARGDGHSIARHARLPSSPVLPRHARGLLHARVVRKMFLEPGRSAG